MSLCMSWITLVLCLFQDVGRCCHYSDVQFKALAPGDVLIGVLKPCHTEVLDLAKRLQPQRYNCTGFQLISFVETLAIINTIETINNSGFLPGIRLGYVICDSCSYASTALQKVNEMLTINDTHPVECDIVNHPLVKVIIGEQYSEVSIPVARLLAINMIPQISTTSSAEILDDKLRFPSFLRTIPSDKHQTKALAQLMAHYGWNWVDVVAGDDDYGKAALKGFLKDADDLKICIQYEEIIPQILNDANILSRILKVADTIQASKANVVLLILKDEVVEKLFQEMIRRGITRIWIASDAWAMSQNLANMNGINKVGGIFGFSFITSSPTKGFKDYLRNLTSGPEVVNHLIEEYKNLRFECTPEVQTHRDCLAAVPPSTCPMPNSLQFKSHLACTIPNPQEANDDFLLENVNLNYTYRETLATWSIAHALRSLLKCNQSECPGDKHFPPWKLLQELKRINFTRDGRRFFFDDSGNFLNGYDLVNWVRDGNRRKIEVVGQYTIMKNIVEVKNDNLDWGAPNKTTPESMCSKPCPPGTAKKIVGIHCCYNCKDCEPGTYTNITNQENCQPCPNNTWSMKGWDHCEERFEEYFKWNDPSAIVLLTFSGIGFLLLFSVLIIFVFGRHSTVFKVAGGELCFVMIAGLTVSFGAVVLFVGRPTNDICKSRQTMYGLGFTLSVSCILVKAFRTFLAFLTDPVKQHKIKKLYKPPIIIICGTAIQGLICVFWLIFDSPKVVELISNQTMYIEIQCNEGSNSGFGIMLSYISLLAFICFILALKGRKVPQRFNETGYIIFSMVIYLFVWICFIPIYVTENQQRSVIQAFAIVVSNLGILFCHFLPKCYMILCKKKEDISKQTYLERVRIFSITTTDSNFEHLSTNSGAGSMEQVPASRQSDSVTTINSRGTGAKSFKNVFSTITTIQKCDDLKMLDSSYIMRRRLRTKSM